MGRTPNTERNRFIFKKRYFEKLSYREIEKILPEYGYKAIAKENVFKIYKRDKDKFIAELNQ